MSDEVVLENARARVGILPALGAAMSSYQYVSKEARRPLLAAVDGRANMVMAPWQNRISGGGFIFEGMSVKLDQNSPLDPFPLHGNAWLLPWSVVEGSANCLVLQLASDGPGPYRYIAETTFQLNEDGSLETSLRVTNTGPRLPFGLGFHPNFTRTSGMLLAAPARTVTLQDERYIPTETLPVASLPELNFATPRVIPEGPINNEFGGWIGEAQIVWPEWQLACRIESAVTRYLLYTPGTRASFLSFEPVTHSVDAFGRPDPVGAGGLSVLDRDEDLSLKVTFQPLLL